LLCVLRGSSRLWGRNPGPEIEIDILACPDGHMTRLRDRLAGLLPCHPDLILECGAGLHWRRLELADCAGLRCLGAIEPHLGIGGHFQRYRDG